MASISSRRVGTAHVNEQAWLASSGPAMSAEPDPPSSLLGTEYLRPLEIHLLNPDPWLEGSRRWGLWKVTKG